MGITMYQRCEQIREEILNQGFEDQIGWHDLAMIIRKTAGSKPETLQAYRKEMQLCGFLKSENGVVFDIIKKEV